MTKGSGKLSVAGTASSRGMPKQAKNLQGQRLGRKGRDTRQRIVEAARQLIGSPQDKPLSLSAVAREAAIGMSSIYTYFKDMTELVLAVLEPVDAQSEEAYIRLIRERWPDDGLEEHAQAFVDGFYKFWQDNSQLLHLRNHLADQRDMRLVAHRVQTAQPVMQLLARQMDAPSSKSTGPQYDMASVLFTGLERVITMVTDDQFRANFPRNIHTRYDGGSVRQQGHLLALAIADQRQAVASANIESGAVKREAR